MNTGKRVVKERSGEVLDVMRDFLEKHHRMPTMKELVFESKMARGSVVRILARLVENGQIRHIVSGTVPYEIVEKRT